MKPTQEKELDLRNLDIVTEVDLQAGNDNDDRDEPFEIWTLTNNA